MPSAEALLTLIRDQYDEDQDASLGCEVEFIGDMVAVCFAKIGPAFAAIARQANDRAGAAKVAGDALELIAEGIGDAFYNAMSDECGRAYELGFDLRATVTAFAKAEAEKLRGAL